MKIDQINIIKTLPHLFPLHIDNIGGCIYSDACTPQILKYLASCEIVEQEEIKYTSIIKRLVKSNFKRVQGRPDKLQYSIAGDIISFWPLGYDQPIRIEFFDEDVERMYNYDPELGRRTQTIQSITIGSRIPEDGYDQNSIKIFQSEKSNTTAYLFISYIPDRIVIGDITTKIILTDYDYSYPQLFWQRLDLLENEIKRLDSLGYTIRIHSRHSQLLPDDLMRFVPDSSSFQMEHTLPAGYISVKQKLAVITDREIFGTIYLANQYKSKDPVAIKLLRELEGEIKIGDFVVHQDYGIAVYSGLTQQEVGGIWQDYLKLNYAEDDELFLPISQAFKLTRYISQDGLPPKLSRLGKGEWERIKGKTKVSLKILAKTLLEHYARRMMANAQAIDPKDTEDYIKFTQKFAYIPTNDQLKAINEVITDLTKTTPMNRLLIGDVGFGKTEVIIRAAYKMIEEGHQVAILCPTTVLAAQHFVVFSERFSGTKYKVENMSRFNTIKENRLLADRIAKGDVDIIIGTHRLLSNDIKFRSLGLFVIDEEQRFGVKQKEKLKKLNYGVHQLSVSATPIPRTLSMALSSIQDISVINTPPSGRRAVHTELVKDDWNKIIHGIEIELERGGQVYFLHNRIETIHSIKSKLEKMLPNVTISIAHGQMGTSDLNRIMTNFYQGRSQILLCTTIIENGLDMPNVNTIVINHAHKFGLSQLHQLRGRVGRSSKQAYCYLFYEGRDLQRIENKDEKLIVHNYIKRLQAIADVSELGAGLQIASHDLEIRGAGNLLGEKQHGHISQLGYSLYMQLLASEIDKLKQSKKHLDKPEFVDL